MSKIDSVINALEKENKKEILAAINQLSDVDVHELAKIAPAIRMAVASPIDDFGILKGLAGLNKEQAKGVKVVKVKNGMRGSRFMQHNSNIMAAAKRRAHVVVEINDDDEQKVSKEEHADLNDKYAERVVTPKSEYIKYDGPDAFYDLIMKTKKEQGWKFKDE